MSIQNKKIVIVHDILLEYGGAERVLEQLLKLYPQADLYTFFYNHYDHMLSTIFSRYQPKSSLLTKVPLISKLGAWFSLTKLISSIYFLFLELSGYDLIISSCHSLNSKIVRKHANALHVCYLYTPPRYLYEQKNELSFIKRFPWKIILWPIIYGLRVTDQIGAQHPDVLVTSSQEVRRRILKYYKRDAKIIPPGVITPPRHIRSYDTEPIFYLVKSRLVKQKGIELAIKTCNRYRLPLLIVGEGYYRRQLEKISGPTIRFAGWVDDRKMPGIYNQAKALIYTAIEEDFGLVVVEAMSYGIPVVAYRSGGVQETVVENKTGVFFDEYTPESLYLAIQKLEQLKISPQVCRQQAEKYSVDRFRRSFLQLVSKSTHEKHFKS